MVFDRNGGFFNYIRTWTLNMQNCYKNVMSLSKGDVNDTSFELFNQ